VKEVWRGGLQVLAADFAAVLMLSSGNDYVPSVSFYGSGAAAFNVLDAMYRAYLSVRARKEFRTRRAPRPARLRRPPSHAPARPPARPLAHPPSD